MYYQQVDGVAMGSLLGPTLANLFLVNYESKWLKDCPIQFAPKYYRRYVDDIFLLFKAKDQVFSLHELSSSQNKVYLQRRKRQQNFIP